ncbi:MULTISPECIES: hypothetical protein [Streptomyces]|uniref:Uncharacterized protein n=3 Tax=Streptomyces violaceusniger group TaxID=2839105 RepID=A0A4D4KFW3_9ACTN|nr:MULTISPECIES: hypothetical protein [Streptomyces]AEM83783.1 hypothetical protein Strvi_4127 [Streptomyces violaceusniger Tu 4113]AQW55412.1 hypothetical protein SHXM_08875 [Streptomyces hygroscopicus]ASQ99263.1 hypothetical protein CGL27_45265 [Streptomyces sp. 11-1-2]MBO3679344.1 hypothetical protein [Streptomyces sp. NEAU-YJ-81]MCG0288562.1 hypothetical protein [Streptomyces sp. PSAA01]
MEIPSERTGVLILRVWVEGGRPDGFRARIVRTEDRHQAPPTAVSAVDDALTAVRAWLDQFIEPDR